MTRSPDFDTWHDGAFVHMTALSDEALEWLDTTVDFAEWQCLGASIVMDGDCGVDVMRGAIDEGLTLRDTSTGRLAYAGE